MINEERVKVMTKLAIYESTKGKKQLNISKYYKRDYVRYNMFKTIVTSTIAFLLLVGIAGLLKAEELLTNLNSSDLIQLAVRVGIVYVVFVIAYAVIAYIVYSIRYERMKPDVIVYNHNLKKLKELYDTEEKELRDRRTGKGVRLIHDDFDND